MRGRWWLWFPLGILTGGLGLWLWLIWYFRGIYR